MRDFVIVMCAVLLGCGWVPATEAADAQAVPAPAAEQEQQAGKGNDQDEMTGQQLANRQKVKEITEGWQKEFREKDDYLVLPGLVADRKAKKVVFLGEATDIAVNDIVEFFVIGETSGHDYEALAISFAKPGDIKKALEFIGMTAGYPVSFRDNRFWPKGERVKMYIASNKSPDALVAVEEYLLDDRTAKTLPQLGFIFAGSTVIKTTNNTSELAADAREPQSIASNYNEPETILDIPYQGNQNVVYDHIHSHAGMRLPKHELLNIVLEQEYKDGTLRVCDLALSAAPPRDAAGSITNCVFTLSDSDGKVLNDDRSLKSALEVFSAKGRDGKDVYVTLSFADNVKVRHASQICQVIQSLEVAGGIRVAPPRAGQLYYRAFIPNLAHLNRKDRAGHPWELRLKKEDGRTTGQLTQCEFVWSNNPDAQAEIKATDFAVATPDELRAAIKRADVERTAEGKQPNIPVMLLITPSGMTFGEIMSFIKDIRDIVPVVHVYSSES
jgi:hypothetical protein